MKIFRTLFGGEHEKMEDCGDELLESGKWREASWFFREALTVLPEDEMETRLRLEEKETGAARRAFEEFLNRSETRAEASDWEEGLRLLDEAGPYARTEPERAALKSRRRWIEERRKFRQSVEDQAGMERDDAARFHRELRRLPRDEADRILRIGEEGRRGYLALLDGNFAAARDHLGAEVESFPDSVTARELLARTLEPLGLFDEALVELDEALRRDPDRMPLVLESARLLRDRRNDAAGALRCVEAACLRRPPDRNTIALHLERVVLLVETGHIDEALSTMDRLCEIPDLDRGTLMFNRAGVLEARERFAEAIDDLRSAVEAAPSNAMYLERLSDLLFHHGDAPREGLACLDRALSLDAHDFTVRRSPGSFSPNRARLLYKIALFHAVLGDFKAAAGCADEALIVCSEPAVQEAILHLRRDLQEAGNRVS